MEHKTNEINRIPYMEHKTNEINRNMTATLHGAHDQRDQPIPYMEHKTIENNRNMTATLHGAQDQQDQPIPYMEHKTSEINSPHSLHGAQDERDQPHPLHGESAPLKGGRGHASLVLKCKLCSRENSIDILPDSISSYNAEDSNQFETVVVFDCRGVEPVDFYPRVGFTAEGEETGTPYPEVSLTEGEWVDYDEKKGESVGIYEIEQKFVCVK
ncbi:CXXC motif containing zinc binding protein-like [Dreissena polymorpha]|uniref:CXXC motif containing zinc binding protein-like n=1 Tax=Dreissena polymorpha TaxID=45954 RepID=UPI002263B39B|nr:CXXC motif containing zinc binding protein-like [Dreissena polymorpha]